MPKFSAALFDLDGVIVDTESQYTLFWEKIGRQDFPSNPTFAQDIKGCTLVQIYDKHYAGNIEDQRRVTALLNDFEATMAYPFISGAVEFVDSLREIGIKTAVVTSSNKEKMAALYKAHPDFRSHFDCVFTSEDTKRSKPYPDCYISAAEKLECEPQRCVVFEDSFNGLRAGKASGAYVVGLTTSNSAESISKLCNMAVPDFREERLKNVFTD